MQKKLFFVLSVAFLFFLWSSSYTAIVVALEDFSPKGLALFRFLVASVLLFFISLVKKVRLPDIKDLPLILICGVMGISLYNLMLIYGQKTTPVAISSLLICTYPIFVSIFSFFLFKEFINTFKWAGIAICFGGMAIASGAGNEGVSFSGSAILFLLAAIILSLYDLEQKQLMKKYTPFELTCYFVWGGTLALMVFVDSLISDIRAVNVNSLLTGIYLGAFPGVAAYLLWAKMILKYSVSAMSCCCYVSPIFTMLIGFLFLNQVPDQSAITGTVVILSGLFLIQFSNSINLNFLNPVLKPGAKLN